ncbi:MAG: hypothetical protein GFH27_549289n318 [Chloroflexi bacterium AL-W]|nr:hypothetical protein [Chloroflexi bacterium AL-N1]NOK67050.1 hypothetical protein [Chloroflexi bacterium AL-N10]NOK74658.1 hypothetical protein [Chloroflexi bacterium AL-N5]NOK81652.1 hypothetical protein [Chloroflexi bacterium AL-W]NOK89122.1 hypothetical protein [Chloroflexi bacterium AL-N15]
MDTKERQHLEKRKKYLVRRMHKLKEQESLSGPRTSPEVLIEIEDLREEIADIDERLALLAQPSESFSATIDTLHNRKRFELKKLLRILLMIAFGIMSIYIAYDVISEASPLALGDTSTSETAIVSEVGDAEITTVPSETPTRTESTATKQSIPLPTATQMMTRPTASLDIETKATVIPATATPQELPPTAIPTNIPATEVPVIPTETPVPPTPIPAIQVPIAYRIDITETTLEDLLQLNGGDYEGCTSRTTDEHNNLIPDCNVYIIFSSEIIVATRYLDSGGEFPIDAKLTHIGPHQYRFQIKSRETRELIETIGTTSLDVEEGKYYKIVVSAVFE